MSTNRIKQLLEFLESDPNDAFTLYALALEYTSHNTDEAKKYFDLLLANHTSYLPTYYHAAQLYSDLGGNDRAKDIYNKGIQLANKQSDLKAEKELINALQNLQFEED